MIHKYTTRDSNSGPPPQSECKHIAQDRFLWMQIPADILFFILKFNLLLQGFKFTFLLRRVQYRLHSQKFSKILYTFDIKKLYRISHIFANNSLNSNSKLKFLCNVGVAQGLALLFALIILVNYVAINDPTDIVKLRACSNPDSIAPNNTYLNIVKILFLLNFFSVLRSSKQKIYQ